MADHCRVVHGTKLTISKPSVLEIYYTQLVRAELMSIREKLTISASQFVLNSYILRPRAVELGIG